MQVIADFAWKKRVEIGAQKLTFGKLFRGAGGRGRVRRILRATPSAACPFNSGFAIGELGASILALWFGTSGPPWRTVGAAGWTRGGPEQDFHGFGTDFGTLF